MKHCGLIRELQVFHEEPEPGHGELPGYRNRQMILVEIGTSFGS